MSGIRQISGLHFIFAGGVWVALLGNLQITLGTIDETKCSIRDMRDGSITHFETVHAAKCFAKRKRNGRNFEEHERAEFVQSERERNGWSVKTASEKLGVSPRTIEAWSSGARAVPKVVIIALKGGVK